VRGIEDEAQRYSYSVFLCNSDENPEKELNYLHLLRRHRIAGLIAVTIKASVLWTEALEKLAASGVPVVELLTSRTSGRVDIISIDDEEGFVKATAHLLDLGHDRIGLIMPPENPNEEQNPRMRGFLKAHALRRRKVAPELLAPGGWHVSDGQNAAAYLMGLPRPPTAIAAANDMAAVGAITRLKELERRVPGGRGRGWIR
jgi:LacI family transcriptional regulator